ncbi:MAG: hypothetical protein WAL75_05155 [Terracidiphilus sp.]
MNKRTLIAIGAASLLACAAAAESTGNPQWDGVWQGQLDGQPSVILTLAEDTGELGGTLVLNIVEKEHGQAAHVARIEPHVLVHPRLNGKLLTFEVRKPDGDLFNFTVVLTPEGKARIHCTNCGADAPQVDMTRGQ